MRSLALQMAQPWPGLQFPNGTFPDYLHGDQAPASTRYGEAILGYGLLQTGIREQDPALIDAGLRGLRWFVRRDDLQRDHPSVFANASVACAYNLARDRVEDHPVFADARDEWEGWLKRVKLLWLPDTSHYANKYLVEVVAVLELLRSGLDSSVSGTVLADKDDARSRALRLVNREIPAMDARHGFPIGRHRGFVLSDPEGGNPLAYQGLSLGFYARALELLGDRASDSARRSLRHVAHASWALAGPDGDLAYFARSQEQGWALALTAYGAHYAASLGRTGAAHSRALAWRALTRLRDAHGTGPKGLYITPSLREDIRDRAHGVDSYAAAIGYSGLALAAVNWTVDLIGDGEDPPSGELRADGSGGAVFELSPARTGFAVARKGDMWFAVRPSASASADDLRYDFGLVALKAPSGNGGWRDVLRPRPHTTAGPDSVGPLLRRSRGAGLPEGEKVSVDRNGVVTVTGGFRTASGDWLRRGVRFRFEPLASGVRLIFPTEAGDRFKYSVFFRKRDSTPLVSADRIVDDEQRVTFHPPARVAFDSRTYASGTDAKLVRANLFFPESDGGGIRVTVGPP